MRLKAPEEWEDFHNEILIMKRIKRHRNICHILDAAEDKKFGYIVMQACSGGELFDRITQKGLTEKEAALAVVDMLSAVSLLTWSVAWRGADLTLTLTMEDLMVGPHATLSSTSMLNAMRVSNSSVCSMVSSAVEYGLTCSMRCNS